MARFEQLINNSNWLVYSHSYDRDKSSSALSGKLLLLYTIPTLVDGFQYDSCYVFFIFKCLTNPKLLALILENPFPAYICKEEGELNIKYYVHALLLFILFFGFHFFFSEREKRWKNLSWSFHKLLFKRERKGKGFRFLQISFNDIAKI